MLLGHAELLMECPTFVTFPVRFSAKNGFWGDIFTHIKVHSFMQLLIFYDVTMATSKH